MGVNVGSLTLDLRANTLKLGKDIDRGMAMAKKKISSFQKSVSTGNKKFAEFDKGLVSSTKNLNKFSLALNRGNIRMTKFQQSMGKTGQDTRKFGQGLGRTNYRLTEFGGGAGKAGKATGVFGGVLSGVSTRMVGFAGVVGATVGSIITMGVAIITMGVALKSASNTLKDFEKTMMGVKAVSQASGKEMDSLERTARRIGSTTSFSASEAALAMEVLAKNGLAVTDIVGGAADASITLAAATGTDLAQSADVATDVMANFGKKAKDMKSVVNGITAVTVKSKFDMNDYAFALSQAGGVAGSVGVSLEDFNTVIAATASSFKRGGDAGTSFKTFLLRLTPEGDKAKKMMDELGLKFFDASGNMKSMAEVAEELRKGFGDMSNEARIASMKVLFGADAYRTAAALMTQGAAGVERMNAALKEVDAGAQAETRLEGLAGSITKMESAWEEFKISVAKSTGVNKVLQGMVDRTTKILQNLSDAPTALEAVKDKVRGEFEGSDSFENIMGGFTDEDLAKAREELQSSKTPHIETIGKRVRGELGYDHGPGGTIFSPKERADYAKRQIKFSQDQIDLIDKEIKRRKSAIAVEELGLKLQEKSEAFSAKLDQFAKEREDKQKAIEASEKKVADLEKWRADRKKQYQQEELLRVGTLNELRQEYAEVEESLADSEGEAFTAKLSYMAQIEDRQRAIKLAQDKARESTKRYASDIENLGSSMRQTFANAIIEGEKFSDVLKDILQQWKRSVLSQILLGKVDEKTGERGGGLFDQIGAALGGNAIDTNFLGGFMRPDSHRSSGDKVAEDLEKSMSEVVGVGGSVPEAAAEGMEKTFSANGAVMKNVGGNFANTMSNVMNQIAISSTTGGSGGDIVGTLLNMGISYFTGGFGGGSPTSMGALGSTDLVTSMGGGFATAANGGQFKVGGSGGTDSQLVQFRASPDETVTISNPEQSRSSTSEGGVVINMNVNVDAKGSDSGTADKLMVKLPKIIEQQVKTTIQTARRRRTL
jgi:TP901 family phage tail tape measure protein